MRDSGRQSTYKRAENTATSPATTARLPPAATKGRRTSECVHASSLPGYLETVLGHQRWGKFQAVRSSHSDGHKLCTRAFRSGLAKSFNAGLRNPLPDAPAGKPDYLPYARARPLAASIPLERNLRIAVDADHCGFHCAAFIALTAAPAAFFDFFLGGKRDRWDRSNLEDNPVCPVSLPDPRFHRS